MCWVVFLFTPVNLFLLGHYFSFISFCTMWSELWPLLNTFGAEHHRKLGRSCAAFEWFMLTKMLWHRCTAIQGCLHTTSCTRSLQHSMVYFLFPQRTRCGYLPTHWSLVMRSSFLWKEKNHLYASHVMACLPLNIFCFLLRFDRNQGAVFYSSVAEDVVLGHIFKLHFD